MKRLLCALLIAAGCGSSANAGWVFVGQWNLGDGIPWYTLSAPTLSGQQAAATLFGGAAADYRISTAGIDPDAITDTAWIDQVYIGLLEAAQNSVVDDGDGFYDSFGDTSAYVQDNDPGCFNRYADPNQTCSGPNQKINYAFKFRTNGGDPNPTPEPGGLALFGLGMAGMAIARRRRKS